MAIDDWDALDSLVAGASRCAGVVRTCHWHQRSIDEVVSRYDVPVWARRDPDGNVPTRWTMQSTMIRSAAGHAQGLSGVMNAARGRLGTASLAARRSHLASGRARSGVPWSAGPRRRASVPAPGHSLTRLVDADLGLSIRGPEQIPAVAADVQEHRDLPVRLGARCRYEHHPGGPHPLKLGVEVVDAQEEPDPARELLSYRCGLGVAVRLSGSRPVRAPGGRTTTHRFGRPSLVVIAGESSTSSNPSAPTKNSIARP